MFRSSIKYLAAAAAPAASASDAKMATLHKLLIGEVQFRNNAPVKACNVEHNFGASWKTDIEAYAKKLSGEQKTILERQIARVALTRFTTRELAEFGGEGPQYVDAVAKDANVAQGKAYYQQHGAEAFEKYVREESKNANWAEADVKKFIDAVKAAK